MDLHTMDSEFRSKISSLYVTPDTIILILKYAMEAVEATSLTGMQKKAKVIELVKRAIIDTPIDVDAKRSLLQMITDGIVSHTIDVIVSASRGELNLNSAAAASGIVCNNLAPHFSKCITSLCSKNRS